MFWSGGRTVVSGNEVEDGGYLVENIVALCELATFVERNPGSFDRQR